jgi:hypothetical protein
MKPPENVPITIISTSKVEGESDDSSKIRAEGESSDSAKDYLSWPTTKGRLKI